MAGIKKFFTSKTFIISICFLLVVALAACIFSMEYTSLLSEHEAVQSELAKTASERNAVSDENAANKTKIDELNQTVNDLNSKINQLNSDISQIKLTKAKVNSSKAAASSATPSPKASTVTPEAVDLNLLTAANEGYRVCYLTFDDGPSDNTLKILDILKQANAKATFFVVGTSKLEYIRRAKEEGHGIALHTNTHNWSIYKNEETFFQDLEAIHQKVTALIGEIPLISRFPGGSSNKISKQYNDASGIMTRLTQQVQERGYTYVDWNVDSTDASRNNVPAAEILYNVQRNSKNKADLCVLMHDTAAKGTTVEALPSIICYLRAQGYRFEALTKESPIFHHGINN